MKEVNQRRYKTEITRGDCFQCCVASLLDLEYEQVPDFINAKDFWESCILFLDSLGKEIEVLPLQDEDYTDAINREGIYIVGGETIRTKENGVTHSVLYKDGKLLFDPHQSKAGLIKPQVVYIIKDK